MDIQKTIENLRKNNFNVVLAENKDEALNKVLAIIPTGSLCSSGGSVTLSEVGIIEALKNGNYRYIDRLDKTLSENDRMMTHFCDYFLMSSNAITENGELYNVDGNGNRIAALIAGPKNVIVVSGINKIVKNLNEAVIRVKTTAAPLNAKRLSCDTYCAKFGKCVSLSKDSPEVTDGCGSKSRICSQYLVSGKQRNAGRITIVLVNETLGY